MDNFIVSARKYRPITFESVVGQQHITGTLKNAIRNQQLAQAFLFCGPRGVGKTTCARILAKTINCQHINSNSEACGQCESCLAFQNGNSFSIHELDAASNNSVDDIRSLIEQVRIPPQAGKYKIYIIDEVHMLSQAAFNAFLKTLEEPPAYAIFILATTEKHKILPTILSRCQIFDFNRIKVEDMAGHLATIAEAENIAFENDALHIIAQKADGGLRDALSMFDQIVSFSDRNLTYQAVIDNLHILDYDYYFRLMDAVASENPADALLVFDQVLNNGFDGGHFIAGLSSHLRNLLVTKDESTLKLLEVSEQIKQRYLQQARELDTGLLLSALNIANQCEVNYRNSKNQRLQVELSLLKMCHLAYAVKLTDSEFAIASGEKKKFPEPVKKATLEQPAVPAGRPAVSSTGSAPVTSSTASSDGSVKHEKPAAKTSDTTTKPQEKPKATGKGWGAIKPMATVPNLQTIFEDKEEQSDSEKELLEGNEYLEIDEHAFLDKWNEFAEKLKSENKITLYTIMHSGSPRLEDHRILVEVENAVQMEQLRLGKIDILNFLRVELRNYGLDLDGIMVEKTKTRKPYTSQEKYQAMVAKNPLLEELRKTFDLGLT